MKIDKDLDLIAEAYKTMKTSLVKEEFEEQMPDSKENAETTYGVDPEEAADYDKAKEEVENVAKQVIECFNTNEGKDWQAELQTESSSAESAKIHIVYEGKGYNLTVELAKY